MLLGNVMALRQNDSTRLLAWSTVSQAGWVVLPVAALSAPRACARPPPTCSCTPWPPSSRSRRSRSWGPGRSSAPAACCAGDRLTGGALAFALLVLAGLPPGIIGLVAKVVALRPGRRRRALAAGPGRRGGGRARHRGLPALVRPAARRAGRAPGRRGQRPRTAAAGIEVADAGGIGRRRRGGNAAKATSRRHPATSPWPRRTGARPRCSCSAPASSCCSACSRGCSWACCPDGTNHPPAVVGQTCTSTTTG